MLMSPKLAVNLLTDTTRNCPIPVGFDDLTPRSGRFLRHGHVVVGDVGVHAYKAKGRWAYDEREVLRAGQALAGLTVDRSDLVEVAFPSPAELEDCEEADLPEFWTRRTWRRTVSLSMSQAVRHVRHAHFHDVDAYADAEWVARYRRVDSGLPSGVSMEDVLAVCGDQTIACTRPVHLLIREGGTWWLPRSYVALLDRWQAVEEDLADRARQCSRCPRVGPAQFWPRWRTASASGYVTLCPDCTRAAYRTYTGHLRGRSYESLRPSQRADEYVCRLCGSSRAMVWDHCHDHGHIRGPLCPSCNTTEGHSRRFFQHQAGGTLHLLECTGCRHRRTLPARFHLQIVFGRLEATERHARCSRQPLIDQHQFVNGQHTFTLSCTSHGRPARWSKQLAVRDVAELVGAYVDHALADANAGRVDEQASEVPPGAAT